MAAKTRTIQLQVIGSKAHVDLEVDSSATIAGIKQRLAREFGLDPKVKLLRKHQTSLSTLMDGEKPPKNGRIVVQGVSELRRVAPPAPPEVAGSSAEAFPKAPARAVAGAGAAPSQPPPWPRPPQQPPAAPAPKKEAKSQHSLWMMAMMTEEELSASQGEFESKATQGAEKKAREEEEARRLKEEAERRTREEEEKAKQAREEAERKAREEEKAARRLKEEAERKAREEEKAARKLKEETERKAREEEEQARKLKEEAERKAREEEEQARQLKEEAERKAREEEEQARKLKEEAERKAREEEAARRFQEESERRAQEEQKRAQLAREEEAERRIREEAERKAREEEEVARRAKEEAERTTRLEEERAKAAREEVETRAREEEEARRAREEAERRANELADKATKAKEEAERRAREEEEARRAREEAEKRASEEEEEAQRAKEEAERRAREEEGARHAREDAERREADARRAMEEAERTAREGEEKARSAREEALRRAREEEEATRAREEMERRAGKEVGPRRTKEEANSTKDEAEMRAREEEEAARRWSAKEAERQIMEEMRLLQEAKKAQAEEAEQDVVTPEEGMVQVSIKHAIKRGEAKVTVPHDATFGDVKKALAKDLGRPELLEGRLVRPTGGGQYQAYYDMEAIRVKRRLLYMGPPIVLDNPQEAAASRSSAPRTGARKAAAKVEKIPLDEDGNPSLTLEQALNMQYDLYVGFADPDFQAELHALEQRNPKTSLKYMRDRQLHLFKVQEVVLPKYGFDSSLKGVYQMLQVMNNFDSSEQFNTRGAVLNDILGITPADATPVNKEEQKEPEQKEPEQKEPEQNQTEQPPDVLDDGQQHDESIPYLMDLKDGFTRLVRIILRTTSESVHVPVGENSTLRELFWLLSQPPWGGSLEELKRMPFLDATSSSEPELRLGDRVPSTIVLNAPMWPFSTADSTKPETFLPLWRMVELHQQVVARVRGEDFFRELEKVKDDNFEERKEGILLQVILDVIPAYGFSGDMIGLELFKAAAGLHSWHDALLQVQRELQEILTEVGAKLGFGASQDAQELPEGFWAPASEEAHAEKSAEAEAAGQEEEASGARAEGEADEVVVRLKHKVDGTELHVMVPSSATMRDVRAAAAEKLGNPSVLKDGRVVKKVGEFLQVYKDDELLGSKRRLLLLGTPLWAVSGDQAQEPLAEEPSPPVGPGKEEGPEEAETVEKAPKAKEGEEEMVEVTLKLSKGDDKVAVSVPKSATIKDVKEALAQKLNRPRLAAVANLVRKVGGGFASYRDLERLGGKRIMTVLGVDNLKAASRPPSAAPNLSVNQALSMQYELHDGFSDPEFQSKLKAIMAMHSPDSVAFRRERTKLILSVQSEVLPRYGFEGNLQGSLEMVQVMNRLSVENEEIGRLGAEINVFLGMSSGGEQQQPASAEQEAAPSSPVEDANVEIKHAVHGTKVSVALPSTATMRDVKEALAARLQKPEYAKRGRIVRSQGSTFTALPEDTVLGRRRQLLYMGPAIIVEPSAEEPTPEPSSRFQPAPTSTEAPEAPVANEHAEAAEAGSFGPMGVVPAQAEAKELGEGEIEVTVKPGVEDQGGSVRLIAKSSMTIIEVKQLLARTLGRPEAAKTARIVRKSKKGTNEGVLVSVRDTEVLGDKWRKRTLLVLNCELPKPEVKAEEASRDQIPIFGIPAELAQHENAFSIGITGREHKDITIQELKRKMLENQSLRRPLPADFMCVMDMRGDGYLAPLADSDKPYELASGQYVKLQFLGFSEEHLAAWLRSGAEARDEATKAWKSRPEPAPKPTPTPLPLARPRAHEDRMINVGLQYSMEQVYVTLQDDSTVLDLKVRLKEEYGVPSGVEVLARAKDGFFVTMEDFVRPKRTVVLKGVPTLNRTSKMLEDDMIKVMDEFNKRYAKAEFQKVVASWREGSTSVGSFREVTREIAFEVLPKFGIAASKEGLAEWAAAARAFMRFPTFAESWRKGQILLGTLGDKEAVRMYRSSVSREKGPAAQRESTSKHGALLVREISSYAALAREKKDADEAIDVMYKRIYEENREELWEGGNVKGHKMPSRFAVRRKYLEMPGTTVLHCTSTNEQTGSVVGGAVVFEVTADGIDLSRSPQIGEGENFIFDTQGNTVDESDDESQDPVDQNPSSHISVGYIDALASTPGSKAGSALLEHLNTMAASEGWDMLALHSVRVEHTLRFWEKQGFQYFGPGKDAAFRLSCLQNFGFAVPIASLERLLPPRPGCLFYAKFLTQV